MDFLSKVTAIPSLPERISGLKDLSKNLWWTWNYDARDLFEQIDKELWVSTNRNPVIFLKNVSQKKLDEVINKDSYLNAYDKVIEKFKNYIDDQNTWFPTTHRDYKGNQIAYFSAEFGFHESLPIYSGGLGVLAGDHVKSASDLGLPFIAIGLLYRKGYFTQRINGEGWQEPLFENYDFFNLPVVPAINEHGDEIYADVDLAGKKVYIKVWNLKVGRIDMFLLDTDIPQNDPEDRMLTANLYGGDSEMRIKQEILLGMGGVRALRKMKIYPSVWHMNDSHPNFLVLERMREYVQNDGLTFKEAVETARAGSIFTTHTPVPAGNDAFPLWMMDNYFKDFYSKIGATRQEFLDLGLETRNDGTQMFSMTILALKLTSRSNGVSELHGKVSRNLWKEAWTGLESVEVPITHVTNGVHSETWIGTELQKLYSKHLGTDWQIKIDDPDTWAKIDNVPDEELWNVHKELKTKLIDFVHDRVKSQRMRHGETVEQINEIGDILDPNALTIGFARRFATYKRAALIFSDLERLDKLLNNPERPVQIIFAGKAHPADRPGQEIIKKINEISRMPQFKNKIVFIENYDMNIAKHLISGVDIWLNNPRRPHEASGTSGEKAGMNGAINFSVLDGWWVEAYNWNPECGWAIGDNRDYENHDLQDKIDYVSMYNTLEKEIIPLYYSGNGNVSSGWVKKMKESIKMVASFFNTHRMIKEYTQKLYMRAYEQTMKFKSNSYTVAKDFAHWRNLLESNWNSIKIKVLTSIDNMSTMEVGKEIDVDAEIYLPGIGPDSINAEIVLARLEDKQVVWLKTFDLKLSREQQKDTYLYKGSFNIEDRGTYGYTVRVVAYHPYMPHKNYIMTLAKYPG